MRKLVFAPTTWAMKNIATFLQMSLVIASSTQFSPRVFKYWERYCKEEYDARYNLQVEAASNTTALVKYFGYRLYVTIDLVQAGNVLKTQPKIELA